MNNIENSNQVLNLNVLEFKGKLFLDINAIPIFGLIPSVFVGIDCLVIDYKESMVNKFYGFGFNNIWK